MEIRIKVWHIIVATVTVVMLIIFVFSAWKQKNNGDIDRLTYDIKQINKLYQDKQKALDSFIVLAEGEHIRAVEAERRGAEKDSIIKTLTAQREQIAKKLKDEKTYINSLDSVGQYKLLRANLTKLLNAK